MRTTGLPLVGQRVDIAGRQLWMHRSGIGGPAVVFVPGGGSVGLDFLLVHDRVTEFTTSVLYDRAGTGWSDDTDLPRTAAAVTDELRALLRTAGVPAPYLLVGHSLGGAYAQRYAQRFPDEVAGLLLLDPAHEDWDLYMPEHLQIAKNLGADVELPVLTEELLTQYRDIFEGLLAGWPEPVRQQLIDKHMSPDKFWAGFWEGRNLLEVFEELRDGGARPDVPLIILSGTGIDSSQTVFRSEELLREQIAGSERLSAAIAGGASHGEHRSLPDASHVSIPMARPDAVSDAARDILDRIHAARI
jgi:pimeloyl-ACP methyl ester carboxylesterase